jgi:hypothetical protein
MPDAIFWDDDFHRLHFNRIHRRMGQQPGGAQRALRPSHSSREHRPDWIAKD